MHLLWGWKILASWVFSVLPTKIPFLPSRLFSSFLPTPFFFFFRTCLFPRISNPPVVFFGVIGYRSSDETWKPFRNHVSSRSVVLFFFSFFFFFFLTLKSFLSRVLTFIEQRTSLLDRKGRERLWFWPRPVGKQIFNKHSERARQCYLLKQLSIFH